MWIKPGDNLKQAGQYALRTSLGKPDLNGQANQGDNYPENQPAGLW